MQPWYESHHRHWLNEAHPAAATLAHARADRFHGLAALCEVPVTYLCCFPRQIVNLRRVCTQSRATREVAM